MHLLTDPSTSVEVAPGAAVAAPRPARVGFAVSRAVGNAVVRNRVKRRLRHVIRERLAVLPAGSTLVIRALAPAATASSSVLAADVDRCLRKTLSVEAAR